MRRPSPQERAPAQASAAKPADRDPPQREALPQSNPCARVQSPISPCPWLQTRAFQTSPGSGIPAESQFAPRRKNWVSFQLFRCPNPPPASKDGLSARKLLELDGLAEWRNDGAGNGVSLPKTADWLMTPAVAPCGHEGPRRRRESVIRVGAANACAITFPCKPTPPRRRCALAACRAARSQEARG